MSPTNEHHYARIVDWLLSPRFRDLNLERQFLAHDCRSTIPLARFCYFNAVFIWGGFGMLDASVSAEKTTALWFIRFAIGEPILLVALAATFVKPFWPWLKLLGLTVTFVLGLCVVGMLVVLGPPLSQTYYVGIILVLFPAYVFAQVRFKHAVIVSLILLVAYWKFALSTDASTAPITAANLTFMATTVYIGLVACFLLERSRRREFEHLRVIARKNKKLRRLSARDDLTRLLNRRRLEPTLETAIGDFLEHRRPTAVMMIDIDNFKLVNDRLGHTTGDRVLIEAAASITDCLRPADSAFRIGGDEFVVLLPTATASSAATIASEISIRFASRFSSLLDGCDLPISLSVGVAQIGSGTETTSDLLEAADKALYQAKLDGKGRVRLVEVRPVDETQGEEETPLP